MGRDTLEKQITDMLWYIFVHGEKSGERFAMGSKPYTGEELIPNTAKKILDICGK